MKRLLYRSIYLSMLSFFVLSQTQCVTQPEIEHESLFKLQPNLVKLEPLLPANLANPIEFKLLFSQRMAIDKITKHSITIIPGTLPQDLLENTQEVIKTLKDEALDALPLIYELQADERSLILKTQDHLPDGEYTLLITPRLQSVRGVPFNQFPGEQSQIHTQHFSVGIPENTISSNGDSGEYGPPPERLIINELKYDSEDDDNDGDAFIELLGSPGGDISAYQIHLINGSNGEKTDSITLPMDSIVPESGFFVIADLMTNSDFQSRIPNSNHLEQFNPQNGPDAIQLFDRKGNLVDALWYGEGAQQIAVNGLPLGEGNPASLSQAGESLSRKGGVDTNDNQSDFIILELPSPGW